MNGGKSILNKSKVKRPNQQQRILNGNKKKGGSNKSGVSSSLNKANKNNIAERFAANKGGSLPEKTNDLRDNAKKAKGMNNPAKQVFNQIKERQAQKKAKQEAIENGDEPNSSSPAKEKLKELGEGAKVALKATWKKLPLKVKLIIIGIGAGVVLVLVLFVVIIAVLIDVGIIDVDDLSGGSRGLTGSYGNSSSYWWPIGSSETTIVNGQLYAAGTPVKCHISSPYGQQRSDHVHGGIDIAGCGNANVIAAKSGEVIDVKKHCTIGNSSCGGKYGNRVYIQHEDGSVTRYAHLMEGSVVVEQGDKVGQGQLIAKVGTTGHSTGNHLHFEIRINGSTVNPTSYATQENSREGYHELQPTGDNNKQTICLSFKNFGYDDNAVAAILVNTEAESEFDPEANNGVINGVPYYCIGFVQWCPLPHSDRKDKLLAAYGSEWIKPENQIEFWNGELNSTSYKPYRLTKEYLLENHTVAEKVKYYCMHFEVPGESVCNARKNNTSLINEYSTYVQNGCS